ncbi:MAG: RnfABCDGE type electron transport complex subunit B [Gammaproteobacteria bacterium]|jgi:electron transport complex protein RnfB|nr:RnfABCDGE type electron transport complex subunit B [Gammaproteobacteria bacterium]
MLAALTSLTLLGLTLGGLLGVAARFLRVEGNPLADQVAALLPGSQCGQCGYPGCTPAAEAIACGAAKPTICPPGGRALAEELAGLLGVSVDLAGVEGKGPTLAFINEALCIGCCKCFKRCPTDAIMGANNMIHSVFADACTGCEKCADVCPTECIEMRPVRATVQTWFWSNPAALPAPNPTERALA